MILEGEAVDEGLLDFHNPWAKSTSKRATLRMRSLVCAAKGSPPVGGEIRTISSPAISESSDRWTVFGFPSGSSVAGIKILRHLNSLLIG